jgi:hypothetical protein
MHWLDAPIKVQWSQRLVGNPPLVAAITEVLLDQRPPEGPLPSSDAAVTRRPL